MSPSTPPPRAGRRGQRLVRVAAAIAEECAFVIVPKGGWTARRAAGRVVLAFLALSGPAGLAMVAALVVVKEREHILRGIRTGIEALRRRQAGPSPAPTPPPPGRPPRGPRRPEQVEQQVAEPELEKGAEPEPTLAPEAPRGGPTRSKRRPEGAEPTLAPEGPRGGSTRSKRRPVERALS